MKTHFNDSKNFRLPPPLTSSFKTCAAFSPQEWKELLVYGTLAHASLEFIRRVPFEPALLDTFLQDAARRYPEGETSYPYYVQALLLDCLQIADKDIVAFLSGDRSSLSIRLREMLAYSRPLQERVETVRWDLFTGARFRKRLRHYWRPKPPALHRRK